VAAVVGIFHQQRQMLKTLALNLQLKNGLADAVRKLVQAKRLH
jgi:hypothetical protein